MSKQNVQHEADPEPEFVSGEAFRQALAPTRDAVRALCAAITTIVTERSLPAADSKAMAELASEPEWAARSDWTHPITDTHTFGAMTLLASTDCARAFARAIDAEDTSLFGHLVLTRSVLETAVIAAWLNAPDISTEERIRRGVCEQLYSATEVQRLNIKPDARARVGEWKSNAAALGFTVGIRRGKPLIDDTSRPSVPAGIDELILGDGDDWQLGRVQWSLLSAVSHGTWYGLVQAFQATGEAGPDGIANVGYGASLDSINTHAACILGALSNSADRRFALMRWSNPDWHTARQQALQALAGLIRVGGAPPQT